MLKRAASFKLPNLPFADTALEPFYTANTLSYHHGKHHQTYVDKLNAALPGLDLSLLEVVTNRAQDSLPLRNNGGGHYNHCLFWLTLGKSTEKPSGKLLEAIQTEYG